MAYRLLIALLFSPLLTWSQSENGWVRELNTNKPIARANIFNTTAGTDAITDSNGQFMLSFIEGNNTIIIQADGYLLKETSIAYPLTTPLVLEMEENSIEMDAIVVRNQEELLDRIRRLKDVEGTEIYAGKKTEVIQVENLLANKVTNNARQIYAQVVGLNIYEDCSGGLQLNIGGRGLSPNRSANFNTRQNGYDISADVLGYPESYYTPPAEALYEIQVIRGASAIQYGPQLGGLVNFKLVQASQQKFDGKARLSLASFDTKSAYLQGSGTVGKLEYLAYGQYKEGNCYRPNSAYNSTNAFGKLSYAVTDRTKISTEFTHMNTLAQQPGGLTDSQFYQDAKFSNRERNYFDVDWNLLSTRLDHNFKNHNAKLSLTVNGLSSERNAVGFRVNRVSQIDEVDADGNYTPRDLILGKFKNFSSETKYIQDYKLGGKNMTGLIGAKYYQAKNKAIQGAGSAGTAANFTLFPDTKQEAIFPSNFEYPNKNIALFTEHIFRLHPNLSLTPGLRYENIRTESAGSYTQYNFDLAGNLINESTFRDDRIFDRDFFIYGVGVSYKAAQEREWYANYTTNFRSVTFNDIRITNPSFRIDPNIDDETGFNVDLGYRGQIDNKLNFDISLFGLEYDNRIGEILDVEGSRVVRVRKNIGKAFNYGFESFAEWNLGNTFSTLPNDVYASVFTNFAYTNSEYLSSESPGVEGNKVEFIPETNLKTGIRFGYQNLLGNFQYTHIGSQYTDATNSAQNINENQSGIIGEIPAYQVADLSLSYKWRSITLETGANNLFDEVYFTRRATGYPGPGIIPSDRRSFYTAVQLRF